MLSVKTAGQGGIGATHHNLSASTEEIYTILVGGRRTSEDLSGSTSVLRCSRMRRTNRQKLFAASVEWPLVRR
jgi:hypothetical protein